MEKLGLKAKYVYIVDRKCGDKRGRVKEAGNRVGEGRCRPPV